jgi:hypothetical protein
MATSERSVLEPVLGRWHSQNLAGVALPVNADIQLKSTSRSSTRSTTMPAH